MGLFGQYEELEYKVDFDKYCKDKISCNKIKRKLNDEDIQLSNIVMKDVFGLEIYLLINPLANICDIASALDIPSDWVNRYDSNNIIIDKSKLDDKYCNNNGIIDFPDDWSIIGKDSEDVENRLEEKGIRCTTDYDYCGTFEFIIIEIDDEYSESSIFRNISEALNIDGEDIGVVHNNKCYIIPRIRKMKVVQC